jgi:hypothetical protein
LFAVNGRTNSPDDDPCLPIALSTDDGLAWLNHNNNDDNGNGKDDDNDTTSADKQIMLASHAFDALSGLSDKLEMTTNAQFIKVHLEYHPVPDIETPEVVVQEEILDFGNDGKSCMMLLTGNLLSESFGQSFLEAIQGEFLFAKYPHGNHYVHVSSQDPSQLFVIANSVIIVLHPFSQVEEALCDCVKNLMQLSNDLLQDYCFHNSLVYNPALDYSCSMIHMMIGAIKDAKYSRHSDGDPFLNDDGVPEHLYADHQKISSEDMQVFTLIFF